MISGTRTDCLVEDTVALLTDWGRWARSRGGVRHCGSAEWRYRARTVGDAICRPLVATERDYVACERAWVNMPEPYKSIIRMCYIHLMPDAVIARRIRIRPSDIERYHRCAITLFGELFDVWRDF